MPKLAEQSARRVARKIIKRRWRQLEKRAQGLREQRDRVGLHDFRVALRRLRASLAVCDEQLGLVTRKSTRRAIKELAAASGALRDWEVVRAQLAALWVDAEDKSALAQNCGVLLDLAQLRAERDFGRIFSEYKSLLKDKIRFRRKKGHSGPAVTMRQVFGLHMLQLLEEMEEHALSPLMLPEPLHALRITAKNLRYTLESVADPGDEGVLEDLRSVQEHLGGIHDIDQTIMVLRRWEHQLVVPAAEQSAVQYAHLLLRAAALRTERVTAWLGEFPANGADLFGRLQERARALAEELVEEPALA